MLYVDKVTPAVTAPVAGAAAASTIITTAVTAPSFAARIVPCG